MTIYLSLLVAVVGLVIYLASKPPYDKAAEVGKIMFWTGLLVFLFKFGLPIITK